jgi:hypothetical protein
MSRLLLEPTLFLDGSNKALISEELWERLVARVVKDESLELEFACRIMDQALGYLKLASQTSGTLYSPSPLVDIGWHTFLLYTKEYASFCRGLTGGFFIHHNPNDDPNDQVISLPAASTAQAMRSSGIFVDDALWATMKTDCQGPVSTNCNGGQGCRTGSCNY